MNSIETSARPGDAVLPASLRLGAVHLMVADLDPAVAGYERSLGLHLPVGVTS
jgi:catechol-2,3-dioxygenase